MQIAIDGPAGAGKSTIAKALSAKLGLMYVDTGAMYRTLGLCCLENGISIDDEEAVTECCRTSDIDVQYIDGVQHMYLNGADVSTEIRKEEVGKAASDASKYAGVREKLVRMQQELGERYDVVMDGRDIGTKVLVNADHKIYLTATAECRAMRRYKELLERGENADYQKVYEDILDRDRNDMTRAISPLCKAEDAVEVDSSDMTIEEVVAAIVAMTL